MKKFLSTVALTLAMAFTTTAALSTDYFYQGGTGQWSVEGFVSDTGNTLCAATTYWDDGSYVGVVAEKGLDFLYMEVYNTEWNIADPIGTNSKLYVSTFRFVDRYGRSTEGTIDYELVDPSRVRFTYLTEKFFEDWSQYSSMYVIMPGDIQTINLGLNGTTNAINELVECTKRM